MTQVTHDNVPWSLRAPSRSQRIFLRMFGRMAHGQMPRHPELGTRLAKARSPLVPEAFLANTYGSVLVAFLLGFIPLMVVLVAFPAVPTGTLVLLLIAPFGVAVMTYSLILLGPDFEASRRRRDIENNISYGLNFMAAMASAGVIPIEIFGALGKQKVYGELAREADWIYRDAKVFAHDLVTALQAAARRTPSRQLEEFLQGSIATVTSGGNLKAYFLTKAEQFAEENRRRQKTFLDSLAIMAESYVVVAAAAPLFLIVILSVMGLLSKGANPIVFLNLLILLAMPVIHGTFTALLRNMRAE